VMRIYEISISIVADKKRNRRPNLSTLKAPVSAQIRFQICRKPLMRVCCVTVLCQY
jgi:hypothetical protein